MTFGFTLISSTAYHYETANLIGFYAVCFYTQFIFPEHWPSLTD